MKSLNRPFWILATITIPHLLFALLCFNSFGVIKTLLKPENLELWQSFGLSLLTLSGIFTTVSLVQWKRKQPIPKLLGLPIFLSYMIYLYLFLYNSNYILPRNIPQWMLFEGDLIVYGFTFIIPSIAFGVWMIVDWLTPNPEDRGAWKNIGLALSIPISLFVLFNIIQVWRWNLPFRDFNEHVIVIAFIAITVSFFFFLIRALFILLSKRKKWFEKDKEWNSTRLLWLIPLAIVFPLLGLALNNGLVGEVIYGSGGVFGDFSDPMYYLIALLNGIFLCMPIPDNPRMSKTLFFARLVGFPFIFYFFLVFLPFLPISLLAILAVGFGFLMLTPLILFIVQGKNLNEHYWQLRQHFSGPNMFLTSFVALMILPCFLFLNYNQDKIQLNRALDYVYAADYTQEGEINTNSIQRTLTKIRSHKTKNNDRFMSPQPYLSTFYKWHVLDNLTLSDDKIRTLENIFVGQDPEWQNIRDRRSMPTNHEVIVDSIETRSEYIAEEDYWKSYIDLDLRNESSRRAEYKTTFDLPLGALISDYYLDIEGRKEKGLLVEKKSALWTYTQIVSERRDPGLLFYTNDDKVNFRVFPFSRKQSRKTGFEIVHKEPFEFEIGEHKVLLGDRNVQQQNLSNDFGGNQNQRIATNDWEYVSPKEKAALPKVQRQPYFHFLMDVSDESKIESYREIAVQFLEGKEENTAAKLAKLDLVGYNNETFEYPFTNINTARRSPVLSSILPIFGKKDEIKGGFYIERAIKETLIENYENPTDSYPVFVVLTDDSDNAIVNGNFYDWRHTFPDNEFIYHLNSMGAVNQHSMVGDMKEITKELPQEFPQKEVLVYKTQEGEEVFLADDNEPTIVSKNPIEKVEKTGNEIIDGLAMQAQNQHFVLYPKSKDANWKNLVETSFDTHLMASLTSFMSVENEAQKQALLRKQDQVMAAKQSLDTDETSHKMSEPSLWILLLILGLVGFVYQQIARLRANWN